MRRSFEFQPANSSQIDAPCLPTRNRNPLAKCETLPCEDECVPMADPACPPPLESWDYTRPFENLDSVFNWLLLRIVVPSAVLYVVFLFRHVCKCPSLGRCWHRRVRKPCSKTRQLGNCKLKPIYGAQVFVALAVTLRVFRPAASFGSAGFLVSGVFALLAALEGASEDQGRQDCARSFSRCVVYIWGFAMLYWVASK